VEVERRLGRVGGWRGWVEGFWEREGSGVVGCYKLDCLEGMEEGGIDFLYIYSPSQFLQF
jgi:hypothetical protein